MANIFIISDTHFGHANTFLKFKLDDGTPMRPFSSVDQMDEHMIERWNSVVRPQDKVYHLGDVIFGRPERLDVIMKRLNGHKRLVIGNHDDMNTQVYLKYFDRVISSRRLDSMLFTHIPIQQDSIGGKLIGNVHGHIHNNTHRTPKALPCPPYLNVSVEVIDYTPVSLEDCRKRLTTGRPF